MKYPVLQAFLLPLILTLLSFTTLQAASGHEDHAAHEGMHGPGENQWNAPEEEANRPNPVKATQESLQTGSRLFKHYCITCHGYNADGEGMSGKKLNPKPANLRKMAGHHSDGDLAYKIKNGRGPMPHWESNISDTNVWHIVNFIQNLKDTDDGHRQDKEKSPHDHGAHKH